MKTVIVSNERIDIRLNYNKPKSGIKQAKDTILYPRNDIIGSSNFHFHSVNKMVMEPRQTLEHRVSCHD
jgi:hypothetical protein